MPKRIFTSAKRIYGLIPEPRELQVFFAYAYAVLAGMGIWVALQPMRTFEGVLDGDLVTRAWAAALAFGCLLNLPAALTGRWAIEKSGLWFIGAGIVPYLIVTVYLQATESGTRATGFALSLLVLGLIILRYSLIRGFHIQPGR